MLVGAKPRGPGMDRKSLLSANYSLFQKQSKIIDAACKESTRILIVGNPANTNALAIKEGLTKIPSCNVSSLSRLDQNRAVGLLAKQLKVNVAQIFNVSIFGNHSKTMFTDVSDAFWVDSDFERLSDPALKIQEIPESKSF